MIKISVNILFGIVIITLLIISIEDYVFAANSSPYLYVMVKKEILKKGGSLKPLVKPKYKVLVAKYAIAEEVNGFVEYRIKETLRKILHKEKAKGLYDGITVFIYSNTQNANTGSTMAMAKSEWWPKGHSFGLNNAKNIADKSAYVESYNILSLPQKIEDVISGLSVAKRKGIYKKIEANEKASREQAEKKYPKYSKEYYDKIDILNEKARSQILKKYNISNDTYTKIISEGIEQYW